MVRLSPASFAPVGHWRGPHANELSNMFMAPQVDWFWSRLASTRLTSRFGALWPFARRTFEGRFELGGRCLRQGGP